MTLEELMKELGVEDAKTAAGVFVFDYPGWKYPADPAAYADGYLFKFRAVLGERTTHITYDWARTLVEHHAKTDSLELQRFMLRMIPPVPPSRVLPWTLEQLLAELGLGPTDATQVTVTIDPEAKTADVIDRDRPSRPMPPVPPPHAGPFQYVATAASGEWMLLMWAAEVRTLIGAGAVHADSVHADVFSLPLRP
jgi:hypothetical protein